MNRFGIGRLKSDIVVNATGTGVRIEPVPITKTGRRIEESEPTTREGRRIGSTVIPMLFTLSPDEILNSSFTANAEIVSLGGEFATQRGFCFVEGRLEIPSIDDSVVYDDGSFTLGEFSKLEFGLAVGREFSVRSFAVNSAGVGYGDIILVRLQDYYITVVIRDQIIIRKIKELLLLAKSKEVVGKRKIRDVVGQPVYNYKEKIMYQFSEKQPYEEYFVSFNFTRVITPDTVITNSTVIAYDEDDNDVTATITDQAQQSNTDTKVYVKVRGGASGVTYKITCRIVTSNGERFEMDGELPVIEK